MSVTELDPALKRLLDKLPATDPDVPEPEPPAQIEMYVGFYPRTAIVPRGQPVTVNFGAWAGPPMRSNEVVIHVRNLKTGASGSFKVGDFPYTGPEFMEPGEARNWTFHGGVDA